MCVCVWKREGGREKASVAIHCMNKKSIEMKVSRYIVSRNKGKMDSVHMIAYFIVEELRGRVLQVKEDTLFAQLQWIKHFK